MKKSHLHSQDKTFRNLLKTLKAAFKNLKQTFYKIYVYLQDGLLVEFLEILGESDVPTFSNMTADNLPDDNMVNYFLYFCI